MNQQFFCLPDEPDSDHNNTETLHHGLHHALHQEGFLHALHQEGFLNALHGWMEQEHITQYNDTNGYKQVIVEFYSFSL